MIKNINNENFSSIFKNYDKADELVGEENVVAYDTFDFAVSAVMSGDAVAALLDETAGLGYMGANAGEVKLVGEDLTSELLGFAFPNDSALVDPINAGLAAMTESGKLGEINTTASKILVFQTFELFGVF